MTKFTCPTCHGDSAPGTKGFATRFWEQKGMKILAVLFIAGFVFFAPAVAVGAVCFMTRTEFFGSVGVVVTIGFGQLVLTGLGMVSDRNNSTFEDVYDFLTEVK